MRTSQARQWSDPVKGKRPSEETLNIKGDTGKLREVLRKVVKKSGEPYASSPSK